MVERNEDSKPTGLSKEKKYGIPHSQNLKRKSPGHQIQVICFIILTYSVSFADMISEDGFIFLISIL